MEILKFFYVPNNPSKGRVHRHMIGGSWPMFIYLELKIIDHAVEIMIVEG